MPCYYSALMVSALGVTIVLGALFSMRASAGFARGVALMSALLGGLALAVIHSIVGLCRMDTMLCRTGLEPATNIASALIVVTGLAAVLFISQSRYRMDGHERL